MASLESLLCNSCGAPLRIPTSAKYVKCNHCNTQLSVHRDSGVSFTESLEKLNETTESLREQVSRLTVQQELADLDREWDRKRQDLMISDKNGRKHVPNSTSSTIGGIVGVVFGCFWTMAAFGMASRSPSDVVGIFPVFGLVFIAFGVFGMIHTNAKAGEYKRAEAKHRLERARLRRESAGDRKDEGSSIEIVP